MVQLLNKENRNLNLMLKIRDDSKQNLEQKNSSKRIIKTTERNIGVYGTSQEGFTQQLPGGKHKGFAARRWIETNHRRSSSDISYFNLIEKRKSSSQNVFKLKNNNFSREISEENRLSVLKVDSAKEKK